MGVRTMSSTVTIELTLEQLLSAIRRLPWEQKKIIWKALSDELSHAEVHQQFNAALHTSWAAHKGISEDEVMADALQAVAEVRAARSAARNS